MTNRSFLFQPFRGNPDYDKVWYNISWMLGRLFKIILNMKWYAFNRDKISYRCGWELSIANYINNIILWLFFVVPSKFISRIALSSSILIYFFKKQCMHLYNQPIPSLHLSVGPYVTLVLWSASTGLLDFSLNFPENFSHYSILSVSCV